jgi:hypothetical protein
MRTQRLLTIILLFTALTFSSCVRLDLDLDWGKNCIKGEGPIVEQELSLPEFSKIDLETSFDVVISQGPEQKVLVVGNQNIIDHLNTNVTGKQWKIGFDQGCFSNFDLIVYITVPAIDLVKLSGSGKVELEDFNQQNELTVSISGSGDFTMNDFESAENLFATISGSGCFYAKNEVTCFNNVNVRCSGSGDFKGYSIETKECTASTSGSGNCYIYAIESLNATTSGSGNIYYKGNPLVDSHSSGSGRVHHSN